MAAAAAVLLTHQAWPHASSPQVIAKNNMQVVGWYHSHPTFHPDPSLIDIENQYNYQVRGGSSSSSSSSSSSGGGARDASDGKSNKSLVVLVGYDGS